MFAVLIVAFEIVLQAPSAAIVTVGPAPAPPESVEKQRDILQTEGFSVLGQDVLSQRLLPDHQEIAPPPPYEDLLEEARRREAAFATEAAMGLRTKILEIFQQSLRPPPQLREMVARALHDGVGGYLAENQPAKAKAWALRALRHFPDTPVDMTRHPPAVLSVMDEAREALRKEPKGRLWVESNQPGKVYLNGAFLGDMRGKLKRSVPHGTYRLWVETAGGMSLPHTVRLSKKHDEVRLKVDATLESALVFTPQITVRCPTHCDTLLTLLARRLEVDRVVGIHDDGRAIVANATDDVASSEDDLDLTASTILEPRPKFSPWYLVPFGAGQFAQRRPVWGATYLSAGAGLLAWHIAAILKHEDAVAGDEGKYRTQRNVSAGLLVGVGVTSVVEAIIVGAKTGQ